MYLFKLDFFFLPFMGICQEVGLLDHVVALFLVFLRNLHTVLQRRKWQPTPVFLPGESQGRGSLVGCRLWGHTELDMTEVT